MMNFSYASFLIIAAESLQGVCKTHSSRKSRNPMSVLSSSWSWDLGFRIPHPIRRSVISLVLCRIGLPEPTHKFPDGSFTSTMPGDMDEKGDTSGDRERKGRGQERPNEVSCWDWQAKEKRVCLALSRIKNKVSQASDPRELGNKVRLLRHDQESPLGMETHPIQNPY